MNFVTLSQYSKEHDNIDLRVMHVAIEHAKLQPAHVMKYGKGTMPLFDEAGLHDAVTALIAKRAAEAARKKKEREAKVAPVAKSAPAAPPVEKTPTAAAASEAGLADLELKLDALQIRAVESTGAIELLQEAIEQIAQQNRLIFQAISEVRANTSGGAGPSIDPPPEFDEPRAPPPLVEQPQPPASAVKLARVAVVGMLPRSQRLIENEFSQVFDLRMFEGREAKGRAFTQAISGCDHVMFMVSFNGHSAQECIRVANVPMTRVRGSIEALRIAMTELYVKLADREKAAA